VPAGGGATVGKGGGCAGAIVRGTLLPGVSPGACSEGLEHPAKSHAAEAPARQAGIVERRSVRSMQGTIDFLGKLA
jgi:hypothetical protein